MDGSTGNPSFTFHLYISNHSTPSKAPSVGIYNIRKCNSNTQAECPIKKQRMMWDYQKQQSSSSFKVRLPFFPGSKYTNIVEILPPDLGCTKEAKDVLVDCCVGE